MRITLTYIAAVLLVLGAACDGDNDAAADPSGACDGAKCDSTEDEVEAACTQSGGIWTDDASDSWYCVCPDTSEPEDGNCGASDACASDEELIEIAREHAMAEEGYEREDFTGEPYTERIQDIDGDGVEETIVYPGRPFAGANQLMTLFLSDDRDCASTYAGTYGGVGIGTSPLGASNHGVLDIVVGNNSNACTLSETQYFWNGNAYEEFAQGDTDFCECDYDALIDTARTSSGEWEPDDFTDMGFYEVVGDLDGDGVSDVLVYPGKNFAGASVLMDVFLSQGDACARTFALETSGDGLTMPEDRGRNAGVLDLEAMSHTHCDGYVTRYSFSDGRYVDTGTRSVDICDGE